MFVCNVLDGRGYNRVLVRGDRGSLGRSSYVCLVYVVRRQSNAMCCYIFNVQESSVPIARSCAGCIHHHRHGHHLFQPFCLRICSSFSLRGSGATVRILWASCRLSRAHCLACLSVGRRMAQLSWPKMLVLIAGGGCQLCASVHVASSHHHLPSTQYGHNMCRRLTRPHAEQRFSDVMSLSPLPAMKRWRFLRYDVFFLGTALRMPSQISASEGSAGSDSEGRARRCSSGAFQSGRTGAGLRAGSRACHKGGRGRAARAIWQRATGNGRCRAGGRRWSCKLAAHRRRLPSRPHGPSVQSRLTALPLARFRFPGRPLSRACISRRQSRQRSDPDYLLLPQAEPRYLLLLSLTHPKPSPPLSSCPPLCRRGRHRPQRRPRTRPSRSPSSPTAMSVSTASPSRSSANRSRGASSSMSSASVSSACPRPPPPKTRS